MPFAVATTFTHGLNVHVVGIVLMLGGTLGLALSLLVWGALNPARRRHNGSCGYDAVRRSSPRIDASTRHLQAPWNRSSTGTSRRREPRSGTTYRHQRPQ